MGLRFYLRARRLRTGLPVCQKCDLRSQRARGTIEVLTEGVHGRSENLVLAVSRILN